MRNEKEKGMSPDTAEVKSAAVFRLAVDMPIFRVVSMYPHATGIN